MIDWMGQVQGRLLTVKKTGEEVIIPFILKITSALVVQMPVTKISHPNNPVS